LARKDFGLKGSRRLTAIARASLPRVSEERTLTHYKSFSAVSNFDQIFTQ
jgi:hypothetical protein